ncbi:MAG: hypothetical protein V1724_07800 [Chloroflexota bacterium]
MTANTTSSPCPQRPVQSAKRGTKEASGGIESIGIIHLRVWCTPTTKYWRIRWAMLAVAQNAARVPIDRP